MSNIQDTGVLPINTSLKVPPPIDEINVIIKIPNASNLCFIAITAPEKANEIVPNNSTNNNNFMATESANTLIYLAKINVYVISLMLYTYVINRFII